MGSIRRSAEVVPTPRRMQRAREPTPALTARCLPWLLTTKPLILPSIRKPRHTTSPCCSILRTDSDFDNILLPLWERRAALLSGVAGGGTQPPIPYTPDSQHDRCAPPDLAHGDCDDDRREASLYALHIALEWIHQHRFDKHRHPYHQRRLHPQLHTCVAFQCENG